MFKTYNLRFWLFWGIALLILCVIPGCAALEGFFRNPNYLYEDNAVLVDGSSEPIEAINNPKAVNVSYAEVLEFIRQDPTDQLEYVSRDSTTGQIPFVCSDFAEAVHNNAESAGIRTGYVSVDWIDDTVGHALNAFETTDLGVIYIDCTGSSIYSQVEEGEKAITVGSWDKVAYIEIGKKYGVIGLDQAKDPGYAFFEEYDKKWLEFKTQLADYNAQVRQYNQEIKNKVFREGSIELSRIRAWESQLDEMEKQLEAMSAELGDSRFKSLGIVKSINVHW